MSKAPHAPEVLEALRGFDSATISNAIEQFKIRDRAAGYADMRLRCQFPEYAPMVGYAVTCTADTTSPGESRPMRFAELLEIVRGAPQPAVVVVQHVGTDRLKSCNFGDMSATGLHRMGVAGVVTDAGNRDRAGIAQRAPGFHVFSPGWVVSHGRGAYLDMQVNVSICGLNIAPGDLLHGDANGLLVVPHEIAGRVAEEAQKVIDAEAEYFKFLESDTFTFEDWKRRIAPPGGH
jgi:4-hydroxy-4-methyl-2-oxoglutarate aldolase